MSAYRVPGDPGKTVEKPAYPRVVFSDGMRRLVQESEHRFTIEAFITEKDSLGGESGRWASLATYEPPPLPGERVPPFYNPDSNARQHALWLCQQLAKVTS